MRIGIAGPFKPSVVSDYLYSGQEIPDIHRSTTSLSELVRRFIIAGHKVVVFTYTREKQRDVCLNGERVKIYITSSYKPYKGAIVFSRLSMIKMLRKIMDKEVSNLDVLHAHWTYDYAAAAASYTDRIPVFCTVRDWCPRILKLQKGLGDRLYWIVNWFVYKYVMSMDKIRFIANSDYISSMIKHSYPSKQVEVVYNIIDDRIIIDSHAKVNGKIVFVAVSQSAGYKLKNIYRLLLAFNSYHKKNNNTELWLAGAGFTKDGKEVQEWSKEGLIDGVVLCGYVNHDSLMTLFDKATCLVHPSLEESFGNTLIEGMARHIPVIGGENSGAVPFVLGHGEYGILCNVYDVEDMERAMKLIENRSYVETLTQKAYGVLKEKYDSDHIVKQHLSLYQNALKCMEKK
jgi:glycosyltransferase involved in cell wall biosynthesis